MSKSDTRNSDTEPTRGSRALEMTIDTEQLVESDIHLNVNEDDPSQLVHLQIEVYRGCVDVYLRPAEALSIAEEIETEAERLIDEGCGPIHGP